VPISVQCPACLLRIKAPDHLAGKSAACPKCKASIIVPIPTADPVPVPLVEGEVVAAAEAVPKPSEPESAMGSVPASPPASPGVTIPPFPTYITVSIDRPFSLGFSFTLGAMFASAFLALLCAGAIMILGYDSPLLLKKRAPVVEKKEQAPVQP